MSYGAAPVAQPCITVAHCVAAVVQHFAVPLEVLQGPRRDRRAVRARMACIDAARRVTSASSVEIASALGRANHTTVLHHDQGRAYRMARIPDWPGQVQGVIDLAREMARSGRASPGHVPDPVWWCDDVGGGE
jgi:hypothetical protein